MGCPLEVEIGDNLVFSVTTHDPDTGVLTDADAMPTYRLYEDETATPILTGSMAKLDDANTTGFYSESIACTSGNGFENGKSYTVYIEATVDSDKGGICYGFKAYDYRKGNTQVMASGAITASAIASNAITDAKIAANALTLAKYAIDARGMVGNLLSTTIATLASQTSFTLTAGSPDDNAYPVGTTIVIRDASVNTQRCVGLISGYTGATKTVTLAANPGIFTMAVGDFVNIHAYPVMRGTDGANTTVPDAAGTALSIIGAAGASLTDLGGMSTAMKAEVQIEAQDAIDASINPHIWYLDATGGSDGNGGHRRGDAKQTWGGVSGSLVDGDIVVFRPGNYTTAINLATLGKAVTLIGESNQDSHINVSGANAVQLNHNCHLRNLKITSTTTGTGVFATAKDLFSLTNCDITGIEDAIAFTGGCSNWSMNNCKLTSAFDVANLTDATDFLIDRSYLYTDGSDDTADPSRVILANTATVGTVTRSSLIVARNSVTAQHCYGILGGRHVKFEDCYFNILQSNVGATGNVYGVFSDNTSYDIQLERCKIITANAGSGSATDLHQSAGNISISETLYSTTAGTIIHGGSGFMDAVNAEADGALADINLDHLLKVADSDDVADDSVIAKLASKAATADWSSFVNTTDSQEAIRDTAPLGTAMRGTDGANTTTPPTVAEIQAEMEESGASALDTIQKVVEGDYLIVTSTTPWELEIRQKGTATVLLRKKLYQQDGTDVTSTDHVVGRHTNATP